MFRDLGHGIGEFEETLRDLVDEYSLDEDFWPEFAAAANAVEERLLPVDRPMFHNAIVEMLRQCGKLPQWRPHRSMNAEMSPNFSEEMSWTLLPC